MTRRRPARARLLAACAPLLFGCVLASDQGALAQPMAGSAAPSSNGVGSQFELAFWQSVATSEDRAQYDAYLAQYPAGTFSALARAKIAALDRAAGKVPAPQMQATIPAAMPVTPAPVQASVAPSAPISSAAVPSAAAPSTPVPAPSPSIPLNPPAAAPVAATSPAPAADPFAKLAALRAARAAGPAAPVRPQMASVPAVDLPARFCSAADRNSFHDTVYQSAVDVADQNNKAAVAYMDQLQAENDAKSREGDIAAANLIAREAGDYRAIAQDAYTVRNGFVGLFDRLMAVPITPCT